MLETSRIGPLEMVAPLPAPVAMAPLPPQTRFVLRGRDAAIAAAGSAFGVALPQTACRAATANDRAALWLGPDEWLLLAPENDAPAVAAALAEALAGLPHALVDVSHRQSGLTVEGTHAAMALNAGCPLDLDDAAFPVGMCTRTVLGKSGITLWRAAPSAFRVEANRSFLRYVWDVLAEAAREFR